MIYLANPPSPERIAEYRRLGIGYMVTPNSWRRTMPAGLPWAADTGCFTNPDAFDLNLYLRRLDEWTDQAGPPLFATAPDVVGDPQETWRRSMPVLPVLRARGHQAAFVSQDGLSDPDWDAFDCLFTGGTTEWKLSEAAYQLAIEAKRRGKWVHMGRVNGGGRLAAAAAAGYDSADGTKVGFGPDRNLPLVAGWLARCHSQPALWEVTA